MLHRETKVCLLVMDPYLNFGGMFPLLVNQGSAIFPGILVSYLNIEQEAYRHRECSLQDNHTPHLRTLCSQVEKFLRKRFRLLNRFCEHLVQLNVTLNLQRQKIYLFYLMKGYVHKYVNVEKNILITLRCMSCTVVERTRKCEDTLELKELQKSE